ncbi:MAG: hypothetical protein AAGH78_01725 [Cyanobacteria bacterium P01_H01_bin.58]
MGNRFKSWLVCGFCLITTVLTVILSSSGPIQAQVSDRPPYLIDRAAAFDIEQPNATAFSIWNRSANQRHEVWFRILGGDALFQQRLRVYKEQAPPREPNMLPPESELIYEIADNNPSDWFFLGFESEFYTYYFDGDNRFGNDLDWDHSKAVRARKTTYRNGDLYDISFEDLNTLDDYNDLEIEVVLVHSQRYPRLPMS